MKYNPRVALYVYVFHFGCKAVVVVKVFRLYYSHSGQVNARTPKPFLLTITMSFHATPLDLDQPKRPYSIDLSLELERQLDNESFPPTPAPAARPQSMDQHVLASLIRTLRTTVEDVTKDRDELHEQVTKLMSDKKGADDTVLQLSIRCTRMEEELEGAKVQMREDEHSINMLRTKVEESRWASLH
jgi:hypothetical protein